MATVEEIAVGLSTQAAYFEHMGVFPDNDIIMGIPKEHPISDEDEFILLEHGWYRGPKRWEHMT